MKSKIGVLLIVLSGLLLEALLGARLWVQATSQDVGNVWISPLMSVTDVLTEPFALFVGRHQLGRSGIIDYSVLVTMEAYFVGMIGLLVLAGATKGAVSLILDLRPVHLPDFVIDETKPAHETKFWQPIASLRRPPALFYVTSMRAPASRRRNIPWGDPPF